MWETLIISPHSHTHWTHHTVTHSYIARTDSMHTWLAVSAREWMNSENMLWEPVYSHAPNFIIQLAALLHKHRPAVSSTALIHWATVIISAKWTKWMAEIMCSFDVCLSVCSGPVNQTSLKWLKPWTSNLARVSPGTVRTWPFKKFFKKGAWPGSRVPLNFWVLNADSSKTVKATDFFFEKGVSAKIHLAEICTLKSAF